MKPDKFNVNILYIHKFISGCLPIYAFYMILFLNRGLSVTDAALLLALWSLFTILAEIPSGVLADRWNRKNMIVIATILHGLCFVVWYFSYSFLMFAGGFALWAISDAFSSGTEEGLIYDNLVYDGDENSFTKIYGKAKFFANVGIFTGIASGGILVSFISIELMAVISAVICFINAIIATRLREKNFYSERLKNTDSMNGDTESMDGDKESPDDAGLGFFRTFKEALLFIKGSRVATISILFIILFANLGSYLDEFDALIINDFGLDLIWVSILLTIRTVFVAMGDLLAPKVQTRINSISKIALSGGFGFILLLVFSFIWNQYAALIFGFSFMILAITEILLINILQSEIKEEGRATVMSFVGVGSNMAMICLSVIYGFLADIFTLQQVYIFLSVYGIVGGLGFFFVASKKNINQKT